MSLIKDLKKKHKRLEIETKNAIKKRLNDRTSDSWKNLRELKKNNHFDIIIGGPPCPPYSKSRFYIKGKKYWHNGSYMHPPN